MADSSIPRTTEVRAAHRFDESRLAEYLRDRCPELGPLGAVTQFAGGQSNPTYLLEAGEGRLVLRKKPPGRLLPSAHMIEREHRIMSALAATRVPVPPTRHLCEDPEIIGTPFYLMDFVPGRLFPDPALPGVSPEERGAMYGSIVETLAELHSVDFTALGLGDYGKAERYVQRQITRWSQQYEASKTEPIEAMDALLAWLPAHAPAEDETSVVHGDFRPGNLLFHPTEPRVVAVLDWELSTLGHPLGDLAYLAMAYRLPPMEGELRGLAGLDLESLGIPSESELLARYSRLTGREGVPRFGFYLAFSLFRLAAICQGVYARSLAGNASDPRAGLFGEVAKLLAALGWSIAEAS